MSKYGQLSEKDELIKSFRDKAKKSPNPLIKKALESKANILENNKTVEK